MAHWHFENEGGKKEKWPDGDQRDSPFHGVDSAPLIQELRATKPNHKDALVNLMNN